MKDKQMGFFDKFRLNNEPEAIDKVIAHIESTDDRYSGLTRHYNHQSVRDSVKQDTGVTLTDDECEIVVEQVWLSNGWQGEPDHLYERKPSLLDRLFGNY